MNRFFRIFALATVALALPGCEAATDKSDGGGIMLTLAIDEWPAIVSVSDPTVPPVTIGEMTLTSVIKNPGRPSSELMTVELVGYEVTFQRDDGGTRVPPKLVEHIIANLDAGGTFTCENCLIMRIDQFNNGPLKDMIEFGFDTEIDSAVVRLRVGIQYFGRTLSGDAVNSAPASFTMEVVP